MFLGLSLLASKFILSFHHQTTVDGLLLDGYVLRPSGHAVICTRDEVLIRSILKHAWLQTQVKGQ